MIHLYLEKRQVGKFKSYEELLEYFNRLENLDSIKLNRASTQEKWNVVFYPHRRLFALNDHTNKSFTENEQGAYENELDLIEVYTGDPQTPEQITVTSELELLEFMREWCFDYSYAHGYRILELIKGFYDVEIPNIQSQEDCYYDAFQQDFGK